MANCSAFFFVSHTIILLPISFELHCGHHKGVTKDAASPSLHAAWGKASLHTHFRLMRILLAMGSSGGSWAYSSGFTYVLIFYPLKAKETHSICMCTCAFGKCVRERACAGVHAILYVWSSEDDFTESALSFHLYMSTEEQTQVSRFAQQAHLPPEPSHSPWNLWHNYSEWKN